MADRDYSSRLPRELRDAIYELVLPTGQTLHHRGRDVPVHLRPQHQPLPFPMHLYPVWWHGHRPVLPIPPPSILSVSRQIRAEALQIYCKCYDVELSSSVARLPVLGLWLSRTVASLGMGTWPFRNFLVELPDLSWANFDRILPLLELLRTSGPRGEALELQVPGRGRRLARLEALLDEALDLAFHARTDMWSTDQLQREFQTWVEEVKRRSYVKAQKRRKTKNGTKRKKSEP